MALGGIAAGVLGAAAGGAVGRAVVEVVGDSSKLQADLAKAKAQTAASTNQMGAQTKKFSALSTGAFVAIGTAAVAGVGYAVKAAASLGEQMSRTRNVFEGSAGSVIKFAEQAYESAGLSTRAALEGAASIGALLDSAGLVEAAGAKMSITMTQLAGDMASFSDQKPEEMLIRLRAGLSGEAEPLRQFGVFLNEAKVKAEAFSSGIAKTGEELTDAHKVQARFNIIMRETAKQQGDFAETLGESLPNQLRKFAGQMENVAAIMGAAVLPIFTGFAKALNFIAPLLPTIVTGAVALGAAFLAYKTLAFVPVLLFQIGLGLEKLRLQQTASAVANFAGSLSAILPALGAVGVGIGALILAGKGLQAFVENITNTVSTEQALATITLQLQAAVASGKYTWDEIRGAVDGYNRTIGSAGGASVLTMDAIRGTTGAAGDLTATLKDLTPAERELTGAARDLALAHAQTAIDAREQLAAELALAGGIGGIASAIDAASDAERTLGDARAEVARLTKEGKKGSQEYKDAVEAVSDAARGSLQSQLGLAGAVEKYAEEVRTGESTQKEAIARVREFGEKAGLSATEIKKLVDQVKDAIGEYGNLPGAVSTEITAPGAKLTLEQIKRIRENIHGLPSEKEIKIIIRPEYIKGIAAGGIIPGLASGGVIAGQAGFVTRGPTMLVGESRKMTFAGKGAEAVIPFDNRGIGILAKALEMAAGSSGGGGGGKIINQYVNFDGAQFFGERDVRQMIRNTLGELRQRGMTV